MRGFANVSIVGRVTADPTYKEVGESGVASFSVAVNTTKQGEDYPALLRL
jgi:single-stranded DNA-binding protein